MTFIPKTFESIRHEVVKTLHKSGGGVCHAKVGYVANTGISKALCGVLGASTSFYSADCRLLTPMFSTFAFDVTCEFCKDHKNWEVWVLDCTSV